MPLVFVYGTLRAGEINDILAAASRHGIAAPRLVGTGYVSGRLYDFGSYPGYVPATDGGRVVGDIYDIDPALVPVLDEIEEVYPGQATLFVRVEHLVQCPDGAMTCMLYPVGEHAVAGLPPIPEGDWVSYRRARDAR